MESTPVHIPGDRPLDGSLTHPDASRCVVACPPHPNFGGSRRDMRLRAVSKQLTEHEIACLRFDYGPWDDGTAEQDDIKRAIEWAHDHYGAIGLFGYSFGASLAILVANTVQIDALVALAPAATTEGFSVTAAAKALPQSLPVSLIVGKRDTTVDWEPITTALDEHASVTEVHADHFFIGTETEIARRSAEFFNTNLGTQPNGPP